MRNPDENGWLSSAKAWIDRMPEAGDFAREFILDAPMIERCVKSGAKTMLDIGCGEGRFCRIAKKKGFHTVGIDPIEPFILQARERDPTGDYRIAFAEELPFEDETFDMAVFYMSLIDIDDLRTACREATRILKPSGHLLIANLTSFFTSNGTIGWVEGTDGRQHHPLGDYLEEKAEWFEWDGVRIRNWHRPLSTYMTTLIDQKLSLTHFEEPAPVGGPEERRARYMRTPFTMMMEWQKRP